MGVPKKGHRAGALPPRPGTKMPRSRDALPQHPGPSVMPRAAAPVAPPAGAPAEPKPREDTRPRNRSASRSVQVLEQKYRTRASRPGRKNAKEKAKIVVALLLTALLIWQLARTLLPSSETVETAHFQPAKTRGTTGATASIAWPIPPLYPPDIRDPMEWTREPATREKPNITDSQATSPTGLIVRGIVYSDDKPQAIIGTELVQQGDEVQGATVLSITRTTVEFERDGEKWIQEVEEQQGQ